MPISCAESLLPRRLSGKEGRTQEGDGEDTTGPFWGGGSWNRPPAACQEGPRWAEDYRGPTALPQTSPPFSPSPSRLAIDRVCDMVDQYGRDIKPAGCLPASASLSPPLALLPFPRAAPRPPTPMDPLPTPLRGQAPHPVPAPYSGRGRAWTARRGGEYGGGQGSRWGWGSHWQVRGLEEMEGQSSWDKAGPCSIGSGSERWNPLKVQEGWTSGRWAAGTGGWGGTVRSPWGGGCWGKLG